MTNNERITFLENKIQELEKRFEEFRTETKMEFEDVNQKYCQLKDELQHLKNELLEVKNNTNQIIDINANQTNMLTKLLEKSVNANISNNNFLQGLSKKQLVIIGTVITVLLAVIKIIFGIPF